MRRSDRRKRELESPEYDDRAILSSKPWFGIYPITFFQISIFLLVVSSFARFALIALGDVELNHKRLVRLVRERHTLATVSRIVEAYILVYLIKFESRGLTLSCAVIMAQRACTLLAESFSDRLDELMNIENVAHRKLLLHSVHGFSLCAYFSTILTLFLIGFGFKGNDCCNEEEQEQD